MIKKKYKYFPTKLKKKKENSNQTKKNETDKVNTYYIL